MFDIGFKEIEQLPKYFELSFKESQKNGRKEVSVIMDDRLQVGDKITDNAYIEDFYRYHDIFHYSFATLLNWSPCARALMKRKRKSDILVDEIEDGAKATITEEAISLIIFNEAKRNNYFKNKTVSHSTLRIIKEMTEGFEVKLKTELDWKDAIDKSYSIFRKLIKNKGGKVVFNAYNKSVKYYLNNLETNISINVKRSLPKANKVYDSYWKFATERQNIFYKRLESPQSYPWTNDPILQKYKFTNAYRATDRVSQYLMFDVILKGSQKKDEVLFRIILFKLFNKIETWKYLKEKIGEIKYCDFNFTLFAATLKMARSSGLPIYSNAYIMASGKSFFNHEFKHENHLRLLEKMMKDNLVETLSECYSMKEGYEKLLSYPSIGTFLAYQYITDINYSEITHFSEMEFVKAGPGAIDGIKKCFNDLGDFSEEDIIKMVCEKQEKEFERLGLNFRSLWGRKLQLIDCQNLFCEVGKYARAIHPDIIGFSNRTRIKQKFQPTSFTPINYVFPKKWNLQYE